LFDIIQSEERKLCRPPLRREGAFMGRSDRIIILALAALGVVALIAMAVITLTEGPELLEFAIVMVFFVAVLLGSYWFMLAPAGQGEKEDDE
jgi:membrane glycosyltransferase